MRRLIQRTLLLVALVIALTTGALAQQTGSITGTVTDQTGASVPDAKVTLTNTATKDVRTINSNKEGFFSFSAVVASDYSVRVEAKGFRPAEQSGIHLSPGDHRNLNVSLAVGTQDTTVVVEAAASAITVDSGDLSNTLDSNQITKLALTGRDVTDLIKTLPGFNQFTNMGGIQNKANYDSTVTAAWSSAVGNGISGAGTPNRGGGTSLTSDGTNIIDPGCNCGATQTVNADMVGEIKVTTSAYGADQNSGPVVIAAVGKSGSSEYHGEAYYHYRTYQMNSNDWFNNWSGLKRTKDHYYYPGGQIGGPIPFTHKKLVGWVGWEHYDQNYPDGTTSGKVQANVPTLSERAGHFDLGQADNLAACMAMSAGTSGWDSTTKTFHGGNRCQQWTTITTGPGTSATVVNEDISQYIGAGAKALFNLIPKPNYTPTSGQDYNYLKTLSDTDNGYMLHARVDYALSENTKVYVSYNHQHEKQLQPTMRWWMAPSLVDSPGCCAAETHSHTVSSNLVHVFNSTTTNEFLANTSYIYVPDSPTNAKLIDRKATGYPYSYPGYSNILPSISNSWNSDDGIPFNYDLGRYAYFIKKVQPGFSDNFSKVFKTHTFKAGISWAGVIDNESSVGQGDGPNGTLSFGSRNDLGISAKDPVVNFETEVINGYNVAPLSVNMDKSLKSFGYYAQDEWKATKRLTLNYGLHLSHDAPYEDGSGKYGGAVWTKAWYIADLNNGIKALPGMRWHGKDPAGKGVHTLSSLPMSGRTVDAIFWGPRFGVAYDAYGNGKTVFRGGIGLYYYHDGIGAFTGTSMQSGGSACSLAGSAIYLSQINATNLQCAYSGNVSSGTAMDPADHKEPKTLTYSFTVSQQLPWQNQLEITYQGSQSSDMTNPILGALNKQIPIGAYAKPDPNPASKYYGQILALDHSSTGDSNAKVTSQYLDYKPYPNYQDLGLISHRDGAWANYHSLQVTASRRQGSLTYNVNYTWSKTLGIQGNQDPINIHNDYGVLPQDRSHVLNATYTYDVGQRFKGNKLVAAALNGWMVSGLTGIQSGPNFQQSSGVGANMGFGGTDTLDDGNGFSRNSIDQTHFLGAPDYTIYPKVLCNPGKGGRSGSYINPACFAIPNLPTIDPNTDILTAIGGNGQTQMPYFHGPIWFNTDMSASRTVRITEHQNVEIKANAHNVANHPLTSFDQNNSNNIKLSYSHSALTQSGDEGTLNGVSKGTWYYGVPYEKFGRRVLELELKYSF